MATFKFRKTFDEIQEPELLPDDWYIVSIVRDPVKAPNATLKEALDNAETTFEQLEEMDDEDKIGFYQIPGAGVNLVLNVRVEHNSPKYNGRPFTKWLPWPIMGDEERYNQVGQTIEDAKMHRIRIWSAAFLNVDSGELTDDTVSFPVGSKAFVFISQGFDFRDNTTPVNEIPWNEYPKALGDTPAPRDDIGF